MEVVVKALPSNFFWPKFDKSWPLKASIEPSKKVAFAAANYSSGHFEKGYQGDDAFAYFNFPICHLMQVSVPKRQAEFIAGRLCAHQLLFDFAVHHDYLEGDANNRIVWPKGIVGCISQSYPYAVTMIGKARDYQSIGLDLGVKISAELCHNLSQSLLTAEERLRFKSDLNEKMLSVIFSLKKSVFKALGPLTLCDTYFEDIQLTAIDWNKGEAHLVLNRELSLHWYKGRSLLTQFDFYQGKVISLTLIQKQRGSSSLF